MDQVPLPPNNQYGNKTVPAAGAPNISDQYNPEHNGSQGPGGINKKLIIVVIVVIGVIVISAFGGALFMIKNVMSLFGDNELKKLNNIPTTPKPTLTTTPDPELDSDNDGIPDRVEKAIGTNPNKMDTDGDSYNDLPELKSGFSPIVPGTAGKLTPEQLQSLKDKIKAVDANFYEKMFGSAAVGKAFVYPDDYKLKDSEIPVGFYYRPIDDEARSIGLTANPGFLSKETVGQLIPIISPDIDLAKVEAVYMASLTKTGKDSEIGYIAIKFNYSSSDDFNRIIGKIAPKEGFIYLKDDKNILLMLGNSNANYSAEISGIADKLQSRLELKRI